MPLSSTGICLPTGDRLTMPIASTGFNAKGTKRAPGFWKKWSTNHRWVSRAAAHDADLSRRRRDRRAKALAEAEDRAAVIAKAALIRLAKRLETLNVEEIPIAVLDRWIKTLTEVELRALGHADKVLHDMAEGARLSVTYVLPDGRTAKDYDAN